MHWFITYFVKRYCVVFFVFSAINGFCGSRPTEIFSREGVGRLPCVQSMHLEKSTKRLFETFESLPKFVKESEEFDIKSLSSKSGMREWVTTQLEFARVDLSSLSSKDRQIVNTKLTWLLFFYIENRRGADFLKKIERDDREQLNRSSAHSRRMFASKGLAALQEDFIRNPTRDVEIVVRGPNKEVIYVTEISLGSSTFIERAKRATEMITFADQGVVEVHPLE